MSFLETVMAPQLDQQRERRIVGIVAAKVASIDDDGAYRLEYLSMGDGGASAPARVMMPMAGEKRGMHFLPEVGDEVVVAFENGDPSLPVILGAVWNRQSPPPDQADASPTNNTRTIVSRSGHELTFDDTPAAEKVTIKSSGGHVVELDDAAPGKISIRSSAGVSIVLDNAGGTASIEAETMLTLKATVIRLEAQGGIQLQTTGVPQGSMVMIDNSLYGLHTHIFPGLPPATGPLLT